MNMIKMVVFSGSAIEKDGNLYLLYTGHVDLDNSNGGNDRIETQCLAVSHDGLHFDKVENNPVIKSLPGKFKYKNRTFS